MKISGNRRSRAAAIMRAHQNACCCSPAFRSTVQSPRFSGPWLKARPSSCPLPGTKRTLRQSAGSRRSTGSRPCSASPASIGNGAANPAALASLATVVSRPNVIESSVDAILPRFPLLLYKKMVPPKRRVGTSRYSSQTTGHHREAIPTQLTSSGEQRRLRSAFRENYTSPAKE